MIRAYLLASEPIANIKRGPRGRLQVGSRWDRVRMYYQAPPIFQSGEDDLYAGGSFLEALVAPNDHFTLLLAGDPGTYPFVL